MKNKLITSAMFCALGLGSSSAIAGLDWTTVHSRANCINNESITWWYLHPYNWRVVSIHGHGPYRHSVDSGFSYTWRSVAIHWGEPIGDDGKWEVWGYHYLYERSQRVPFDTTYTRSCDLINGW